MSQIYKSSAAGPVPPSVPTSFVTDVNSPAVPAANVLDVFGGEVVTNNDKGIQTDGSSGSNVLTVQLTNRLTGTLTTTDAALHTILTLPLGASPGTIFIDAAAQAFQRAADGGPNSGAYTFTAAYKTNGAVATVVGSGFHDVFEDPAFAAVDIFTNASGNNAIIQVQGLAGTTIRWNAVLTYRQVN